MAAIRPTNNAAEVVLRKALHRLGLRYRLYDRALPGTPDIVFAASRVAVFVDGDFWHGRELLEGRGKAFGRKFGPANREFWLAKIRRNIERDKSASAALRSGGWRVIRLWETDIKRNIDGVAAKVAQTIRRQSGQKCGIRRSAHRPNP